MSKYLELPWSVEDTIENLKELKDGLQEKCIIQNLHGRGEKDAEEIAFDFDRAINALEEIQKYRAIGTPEECRAAMILMKKNASKKFPIMGSAMIPWEVLEPHEPQAITNHGQTLQKLASRGGLDWGEAAAILEDRRFEKKDMDERASRDRVLKAIDDFYMIGVIKNETD